MNADAPNPSETTATPPPLLPGQILKHFRVEGLLGEGGMGRVYRAYDTQLHRPVAVKLLSSDLTSDPNRKQRLLQEARAAARISHPAIAQIYFVDEQDGVAFIVMELVEGQTVRELIRKRELDLLGAIEIGIQVAEALARAQALGIVHRDIKPANVMLTGDGHVKILDFGLAKLLDDAPGADPASTQRLNSLQATMTEAGMVKGTPAYMSPEQVRGLPVDFRADIFSLGVLVFEMTTGQSPFRRGNFMDSLYAAAFGEAPPMTSIQPHIPEGLQRIVSRCLKKEPADRYANAGLVAEELRRLRRETQAGVAHQTSWNQRLAEAWEQLWRQPRTQYVWFGAGAAGLGLAWYLSHSKGGQAWMITLALAGVFLYRHIRNRPHRIQELFVRRVAKIPEVRLIAFHDRQYTVLVDRPVAQLYGRINQQLRTCNRKLYFGQPSTVSILHEMEGDQLHKLLASPGVQYVREDVVEK